MDARTKVDCFTQDALEQIKDVVKGNEPTYINRGGVGKDVRELSDFALQQIKDAVGSNGGGGTLEFEKVKSVWYFNEASQSQQKLDFTIEDGVLVKHLDLRSVAEHDGTIAFFKSENPTSESVEDDLILGVQIEGTKSYPSINAYPNHTINNPNYGWIYYIDTLEGFTLSFSYDSIKTYLELTVQLYTIN